VDMRASAPYRGSRKRDSTTKYSNQFTMKTEHKIASTQAREAAGSATPTSGATPTPKASKTNPIKGVKLPKQPKASKAVENTSESDSEPVDRLPTTLAELKKSKSGLVAVLYLSGKDHVAISKELKTTFRVSEAQALKITRRIEGRVRLYQRIFQLVRLKE